MPGRRVDAVVLLLAGALTACGDGSGHGVVAGWGPPQLLGTGSYVGSLAGDGNGRAALVWIAPGAEDTGASIVSRRFVPGTGWAPLETVDPPGPNIFQNPVAAMDTQGAILAVWPDTSAVLASRFVSGSGWSAPTPISRQVFSRLGLRASPAVGFHAGGRALAAWSECCRGSGAFEIGSNRFDPATGWLSPEVVWAIGAPTVSGPALAVSASGFSLAVWAEERSGAWGLWMSTFDPRRGWAVAQPVGLLEPARLLYGLRVALNDTGTGFAVWTQDDVVFASRYTTVTGFGTPEVLGRGGCGGLAVDAAGSALALMVEPPRLLARRYAAGGWEPPQSLPAQVDSATGDMSMDAGGNAWFVWTDATGVWARRYVVGQGLAPAEPISRAMGLGSRVVADAQGGALAVWLEKIADSYDYTIMASRYTR